MAPLSPDTALPGTSESLAWHALSVRAVAQHWAVDPLRGLDHAAVAQRRTAYGPNALPEAPPRPAGDAVAADARMLDAAQLQVAEAALTALTALGSAVLWVEEARKAMLRFALAQPRAATAGR